MKKMSTGQAANDGRVAHDFGDGVEVNQDAWRVLKRLHDLGSKVELWVRTGNAPAAFKGVCDLDLRGVTSAHFADEDLALRELAKRAPDITFRRRSNGYESTLGRAFFPHGFAPPAPLPAPTRGFYGPSDSTAQA